MWARAPAASGRGWRISSGVSAGVLLGFFCYLPAVNRWQHYGDVPQPRVYPHESFTSLGSDPPPVGYWVSWAGPVVFVVACGLMTIPWRAARQFALPLVGAFVPMAALVAWIFIGMELFFTPD
ncbi:MULTISPECIES: hypothetical protein [unclassified Rhodococcus (in: high G+C Gram-positive bacteria)]|uniref:hypothetical protein n=1 Tax=unclassified Rhodococcus (in: high G+C Gram-positive bacteria) TaxID=192944 RepID=UPI001639B333|nr:MULTISPECIES: hypothetical protein [unclassified Rhodococcus (in: high G+C Gram-positive bacteria)]MBC2638111.1 hypothetical protein [Rhodococcus sp. 3A]MBC2897144.1 hypothetical protein [Rhodococcus sp. 4CII]